MIHQFQCLSCYGVYPEASVDGAPYHHACPGLKPDKDRNVPERENARNENIDVNSRGTAMGIKAEGLGVKCLTSTKVQEPAWITKLYQRIDDLQQDHARGEFKRA